MEKVKFINEWEKHNRVFSGESWKDVVKGLASVLIVDERITEDGETRITEDGETRINE